MADPERSGKTARGRSSAGQPRTGRAEPDDAIALRQPRHARASIMGILPMTERLPSRLAAVVLCVASLAAIAQDATVGALTIGHPWSRATPPAGRTGAGYLTIENRGATDDRLTGAAIDPAIADAAEFHSMTMDNGIMRMRPVAGGVVLPAGQTVELSPGGIHIMLVGLKAPLKEGTRVPLTLTFEKAGTVTVELDIGKPGAAGPMAH